MKAPLALGVAAALIVTLAIFLAYRKPLADYTDEETALMKHDNGSLCEKFGFAQGTPKFVQCSSDLSDLRLKHEKLIAYRFY